MNFALMVSCKVEEKLALVERGPEWRQSDEALAYHTALSQVLEENGRAWADGNIRVGDYILISMFLLSSITSSPSLTKKKSRL